MKNLNRFLAHIDPKTQSVWTQTYYPTFRPDTTPERKPKYVEKAKSFFLPSTTTLIIILLMMHYSSYVLYDMKKKKGKK